MDDSFPAGASFPESAPASTSPELERWYRRFVACYPRSFRRENTEEIIAVLLATAREDQRRPSLAEAADLLRGAARMRLGMSHSPWTVRNAVRLMYLGAVGEIAVIITLLVTADSIRAATRAAATRVAPAEVANIQSMVNIHIVADVVVLPFAVVIWILIAWTNGKGYDWARAAAIIAFAVGTVGVIFCLAQGDLTYAPVSMSASCAVWAIGLAVTVLLVMKQSWPYYESQPAPVREVHAQ